MLELPIPPAVPAPLPEVASAGFVVGDAPMAVFCRSHDGPISDNRASPTITARVDAKTRICMSPVMEVVVFATNACRPAIVGRPAAGDNVSAPAMEVGCSPVAAGDICRHFAREIGVSGYALTPCVPIARAGVPGDGFVSHGPASG